MDAPARGDSVIVGGKKAQVLATREDGSLLASWWETRLSKNGRMRARNIERWVNLEDVERIEARQLCLPIDG